MQLFPFLVVLKPFGKLGIDFEVTGDSIVN